MVGADIANLANEAALLAARRGHTKVERLDFTDSLEKIILGAPRGIVLSEEEKRRTAYHEAGHAIVGMMTPGADPVRKVSIIPRTMSLGVTISSPDAERTNYDVDYLVGRIRVALGGRIAEELVYDCDQRRRRVRHPAADGDRAPDGRPLGHEPGDRPDRGDPLRVQRPAAARRVGGLRVTRRS